jgi:hypothetical protein
MMPKGVELQIQRQVDNLAAYKAALAEAVKGRTKLWQLVHDSNDETYINRINGTTISGIDARLSQVSLGQQVAEFFTLHDAYFQNDAKLPNITGFSQAFSYYRWRVSQHLAQIYRDVRGSQIDVNYVFPRPDLVFGQIAYGQQYEKADDLNTAESGPAKIAVRAAATLGEANWTIKAKLQRNDGSPLDLQAQLPGGAALGTERVLGETPLSGDANAEQKDLPTKDTRLFKAGEPVLVQDGNNQELATVEDVQEGKLMLKQPLRFKYAQQDGAKVTPLFKAVSEVNAEGGSPGDVVELRVAPDRMVTL